MWNALNTVKSQMILNTTEPKIVRIAGRSECPIPLSAPPLISYEPVISSRSITIAILMIAYLITVGSVVKKVMKNPLPSMNITLTQPVKIQLKSIQSLNTFLHLSNCAVVLTCECNGCLAERTYYIVCNVLKVEFSR